jgi:hypothetical protein
VDEADAAGSLDERRRMIHERGRGVAERMRLPTEPE